MRMERCRVVNLVGFYWYFEMFTALFFTVSAGGTSGISPGRKKAFLLKLLLVFNAIILLGTGT